jgi:hypothetical protein
MARELYECPKCGSLFFSRKVRTAHKKDCNPVIETVSERVRGGTIKNSQTETVRERARGTLYKTCYHCTKEELTNRRFSQPSSSCL